MLRLKLFGNARRSTANDYGNFKQGMPPEALRKREAFNKSGTSPDSLCSRRLKLFGNARRSTVAEMFACAFVSPPEALRKREAFNDDICLCGGGVAPPEALRKREAFNGAAGGNQCELCQSA